MFSRKIILTIIEKVSLWRISVAFLIFIFAISYYFLIPYDNGIIYNPKSSKNVSFLNALYFSVVTFSSLGYGDIQPIGWSKFISVIEVLLGLAMMGIILAKITSRKLSYHVRRLFSSDAQKRFDVISAGFENLKNPLKIIAQEISKAFQKTPSSDEPSMIKYNNQSFDQSIVEIHKQSRSFRDYMNYEIEHGDIFTDAPLEAIKRTGDAIEQVLFSLGQLIISMTPEAKVLLLSQSIRKKIAESLECLTEVSSIVFDKSNNSELKLTFSAVKESCTIVTGSYASTPDMAEPPDQILESSNDPQI